VSGALRRIPFGAILAALPDAGLSLLFLVSWIQPLRWGAGTVSYLMLLMLLEFVSIHASAFLGKILYDDGRVGVIKVLMVLGLGAFYTIFVGAFCLVFHTRWPLWAFWGLIVNRLSNVIMGNVPDRREMALISAGWAWAVAAYIVSIFATIFLPIPRLGLTADVQPALHLPGSGVWVDDPQRLVAAGVLYFGAQAVWSLLGQRWVGSGSSA
jgi:hypothetical protein